MSLLSLAYVTGTVGVDLVLHLETVGGSSGEIHGVEFTSVEKEVFLW